MGMTEHFYRVVGAGDVDGDGAGDDDDGDFV